MRFGCTLFWFACVSKPPMLTKKIWRLRPSAGADAMMCATVCNCVASGLLARLPVIGFVYCVGAVTVTPASAAFSVAPAEIERLTSAA